MRATHWPYTVDRVNDNTVNVVGNGVNEMTKWQNAKRYILHNVMLENNPTLALAFRDAINGNKSAQRYIVSTVDGMQPMTDGESFAIEQRAEQRAERLAMESNG